MKITVIVFLNKKCSLVNEELVTAVVPFTTFDILSVVFTTLQQMQKTARQSNSYKAKT